MSELSKISGNYDAVLSDVWGVLHNGVAAHPSACEALVNFRAGGGRVVLITNAPRPANDVAELLDGLNVPRTAYDAIMSSGDVTRTMLEEYRGRSVHYVGPPTDNDGLFEGLDIARGPAETADAILVTDLDHDDETPDMYNARMGALTSPEERYMRWRNMEDQGQEKKASLELETLVHGVFAKERLLDIVQNFIAFKDDGGVGLDGGKVSEIRHLAISSSSFSSSDAHRARLLPSCRGRTP